MKKIPVYVCVDADTQMSAWLQSVQLRLWVAMEGVAKQSCPTHVAVLCAPFSEGEHFQEIGRNIVSWGRRGRFQTAVLQNMGPTRMLGQSPFAKDKKKRPRQDTIRLPEYVCQNFGLSEDNEEAVVAVIMVTTPVTAVEAIEGRLKTTAFRLDTRIHHGFVVVMDDDRLEMIDLVSVAA